MKYQVRIRDAMSDSPASKLFDTYEEAQQELEKVREKIKNTWGTPEPNLAYIWERRMK